MVPDHRDGKAEADRIARSALASAAEAADAFGAAAPALSGAIGGIASHAMPRHVGLPALRLLRHAALSACAGVPDAAGEAPFRVLDQIDVVVTAMGGVPLLLRDEDDWGFPEDGGEPVSGEGIHDLALDASEAACAALDLAERAEVGPLLRDARALAGQCLALAAGTESAAGVPGDLLAAVLGRAEESAERLEATAVSWCAAGGATPLLEALAAAAGRTRDRLSAVHGPAAGADAPGV